MNETFSKSELERYSRHLILPEFNILGQQKLKKARVLVVGTGGLGSPLLLYLAAAGVGTIGLIDFDRIDESNLQRQVLFTTEDVGKLKVEVAAEKLQKLNPYIKVIVYNLHLTSENTLEIIQKYDVVADGTDNFPTRYLVNDACVLLGKPLVYASIYRFEGQVSVFNYPLEDGEFSPNYRDLFPEPPPPELVPSCAEGGVLGVLPGMIGSMQANEVIKVITEIGKPLVGRLLLFDALNFETQIIKFPKQKNTIQINQLIDYEQFCNPKPKHSDTSREISEITVQELAEMQKQGNSFQLIDVREPYEYDISNLGGKLIPLKELENRVDELTKEELIIVYCRTGKRSVKAVQTLLKVGFTSVKNLKGGILAWIDEVDASLAKY